MPRVLLASALSRWIDQPGEWRGTCEGSTIREILTSLFTQFPTLRGYVLDETGTIRHHVVAFIDGDVVRDKHDLSQPVPATSELQIFQALSGG